MSTTSTRNCRGAAEERVDDLLLERGAHVGHRPSLGTVLAGVEDLQDLVERGGRIGLLAFCHRRQGSDRVALQLPPNRQHGSISRLEGVDLGRRQRLTDLEADRDETCVVSLVQASPTCR